MIEQHSRKSALKLQSKHLRSLASMREIESSRFNILNVPGNIEADRDSVCIRDFNHKLTREVLRPEIYAQAGCFTHWMMLQKWSKPLHIFKGRKITENTGCTETDWERFINHEKEREREKTIISIYSLSVHFHYLRFRKNGKLFQDWTPVFSSNFPLAHFENGIFNI